VRWGHKADYWRSFGDVNKETFASMFASLFNSDMAAAYEKYLPDSYKYFKEKLAADVKRLDRTQSVEEKLKEMEKAKKKMQKTRKKIMSRTSY
jgi:N-glycosylase/DNA lyase